MQVPRSESLSPIGRTTNISVAIYWNVDTSGPINFAMWCFNLCSLYLSFNTFSKGFYATCFKITGIVSVSHDKFKLPNWKAYFLHYTIFYFQRTVPKQLTKNNKIRTKIKFYWHNTWTFRSQIILVSNLHYDFTNHITLTQVIFLYYHPSIPLEMNFKPPKKWMYVRVQFAANEALTGNCGKHMVSLHEL